MEDKLLDFFDKYSINPLLTTSRSFIFDCPACHGKKKLYIQKSDGRSVCFRQKTEDCPKSGSKVYFILHLLSGLPLDKIKSIINNTDIQLADEIRVNFDVEKKEAKKEVLELASLPDDFIYIDENGAEEGLSYLVNRGLTSELLASQIVGYSPSMRRVIFPVIMDNLLVGWQGRTIDNTDKAFRMKNLPGIWKSKSLMFYDNLKNANKIIIAEGAVSALKFANVGNFVATMGKNISNQQLEIIINTGIVNIYLALDRDAIDKIHKIRYDLKKLNNNVNCYLIPVPDNRDDFGDCTFDECTKAFENAELITGDEIYVTFD